MCVQTRVTANRCRKWDCLNSPSGLVPHLTCLLPARIFADLLWLLTRARERRPRLREHHELQLDDSSAAGTFQDLPYAIATSCDAAGEERSVLKSGCLKLALWGSALGIALG